MKSTNALLIILSMLLNLNSNRGIDLTLIKPKPTFNLEILDQTIEKSHDFSSVIMLRIRKNDLKTDLRSTDWEIRITSLDIKSFDYFRLKKDKYFGYFIYKKHTVLVYGNVDESYFFYKQNSFKDFAFISYEPIDYETNPPVSVEPIVVIYKYTNCQFAKVQEGMFIFGE